MMNVQITSIAPIHTVMLKRFGPYEGISETFDQLYGWVESQRVPVQRMIGVYWDNPEFVQASKLRSVACVEVPESYQITDRAGLRAGLPLLLEDIPGGEYATARHVGPYEQLGPAWEELTRQVEGQMGRRIREKDGAFEVYVNDPSETPPQHLITELYMPLV
jgi:AraC family transcriptional regulator